MTSTPKKPIVGLVASVTTSAQAGCRGYSVVKTWIAGVCLLGATAGSLPAESIPVETLIQQGDAFEKQLDTKDALATYLEAEKQTPENADLKVKIARQYRHLMAETSSDSEKLRLAKVALEYGKQAAAIAPGNSDAQLSPAISYGKMLPLLGKKEQLETSKLIQQSTDKALKLNPKNDLAWHIKGRWYRGLAEVGVLKRAVVSMVYGGLPEATPQDAVDCFQKAHALNPNRVIHCIELGSTYASMGDEVDAKKYLKKGLAMKTAEKDDAAAKQSGRQQLAKLE